ncbi:unnamed protein product [Clonostachys solani]|uniref:Uncharacterized protein n=1 Tax=Clonostachys solani TaxID=160281 RepID=A0A9N9YW59_9HYPO|nr:unnamed protein product [Clonostachys solani]
MTTPTLTNMNQTTTPHDNFGPLHMIFQSLGLAHNALKDIRKKVQPATDYTKKTNEIDTDIKKLEKRSFEVLNGKLSKGGYDHPASLDVAWRVIDNMKILRSAFDEDDVQELAKPEDQLYDAHLLVAITSMGSLELLIPETESSPCS